MTLLAMYQVSRRDLKVLYSFTIEQEEAGRILTSFWYRRRSWKKVASFPTSHNRKTVATAEAIG